jgi:MoxR-like ATPase
MDKTVRAKNRPVIIITSNAKKDLSDPFLGRCNFHHIAFPDPDMMRRIIEAHFPGIDNTLAENAINIFYQLRTLDSVEKRPATRELINWIRALTLDPDFNSSKTINDNVPFLGILFKKSQDYTRAAYHFNGSGS